MKNIKLIISYDGTEYVGWQVQKNGIGIEQVINEHLSKLLNEEIIITGASRTDSGVHAMGNVAGFFTETKIPAEKISFALNQRLPEDIRIVSSEEVPLEFHPRYSAKSKIYQYNILNCRYNNPLYKRYNDYVYYPLDVDKMKAAADYLIGEHDFTAFSTAGGQQKTTVRNIISIDITQDFLPALSYNDFVPSLIHIKVEGNGFLYNMVRIIAGTLEKTGIGVYPPEHVKEILESRDRRLSAPKASARGLTLLKINY